MNEDYAESLGLAKLALSRARPRLAAGPSEAGFLEVADAVRCLLRCERILREQLGKPPAGMAADVGRRFSATEG